MNEDEQRFEAYLGEFQPVRPRPLQLVAQPKLDSRRIAAAAIAAAVIAAVSWLSVDRNPTPISQPHSVELLPAAISVRELTRIALDDPKQLDIRIDEAAPTILPCCQGPKSSLAQLAKE